MNKVILLTVLKDQALDRIKRSFQSGTEFFVVEELRQLLSLPVDQHTSLISFGTGVIVPNHFLDSLSRPAYNVHAGSPDFPGRDPHHHAVYRNATRYGATLHRMVDRVDAGPIVGVELFDTSAALSPQELLAAANEAGLRLIERLGDSLLTTQPLPELPDARWGATKTRRADLHRMAQITPLISEAEFIRRFRAFDGGSYDNLNLQLHGYTFRIDKRHPPAPKTDPAFVDFTEGGFRALIRALKQGGYHFARYANPASTRHVLWRHDVDFSMHRAARLAEIEAEEGVVATYFVHLRCAFYSVLEPEILALIARIRSLGHEIGLHFDAGAYATEHWDRSALEAAVARERGLLEVIIEAPVRIVSWHNPDRSNLLEFDDDEIAGLISAYGGRLRRDYTYCSDSNGYWRFRPMGDVIAEGHERLHLLTHPAWWTPDPLSPSDRIDRAILGRARAVRQAYNAQLASGGRKNMV